MTLWVKTTDIYTNCDNSEFPFALFGNSAAGQFGWVGGSPASFTFVPWVNPGFQSGVFREYDFKPQFDDNVVGLDGLTDRARFARAKWMDLGGILIETGAGELQIAFRAPGSNFIPNPNWYQQQCLEASPQGGQRMVSYDTVPLLNGCCEIAFTLKNYPDNGQTPGGGSANAIGWNLKIKKFGF